MPKRTAARAWHDRTRRTADAVRLFAALSIGVCALWMGLPETIGFTVVFLGLLIPRMARLAGPFDAGFCLTIFVATWSGIAGLYRAISWWDLLIHFITAGASAAALFLVLARTGIIPGSADTKLLPRRSIVALTLALGLAAAVMWEFFEWAGNAYLTKAIHVGYNDTVADLAVGGLGALLAGMALAGWKTFESRADRNDGRQQAQHEEDTDSIRVKENR